jgi:hypothetical protein
VTTTSSPSLVGSAGELGVEHLSHDDLVLAFLARYLDERLNDVNEATQVPALLQAKLSAMWVRDPSM